MLKPISSKLRRTRSVLGRFRRDKEASVAIEFGMLILPFSLVIFAVLESCASFAAQQVMANATDEAARQIRTGQEQGVDSERLKKLICDDLSIIVSDGCPGLMYDLRQYTSFPEAADDVVRMNDGDVNSGGFRVDPGGPDTINMLRVFYRWPIMTDFIRYQAKPLAGYTTLLYASAIWKNEPFDPATPATP